MILSNVILTMYLLPELVLISCTLNTATGTLGHDEEEDTPATPTHLPRVWVFLCVCDSIMTTKCN